MSDRRFDVEEFFRVLFQAVEEYLASDAATASLSAPDDDPLAEPLDYPPPPVRGDGAAQLRRGAVIAVVAFLQQRMEPEEAARKFLQLARTATDAVDYAMPIATERCGGGKMGGKLRLKARRIERGIAQGLRDGMPVTEIFERLGISRATGYRYLQRLS